MHRRRLNVALKRAIPGSNGLVIHNVVSGAILQFRSAFGFVRTPGIFDTDSGVHSPRCCFDWFSTESHLESCFVVPVWVDLGQLAGNPVVLPHKQGVEHRQHLKVVFHFNFMVIWFSKRLDEFKVINLFFHEVR